MNRSLEDLNGFEIIELEKTLGVSLSQAESKGAFVSYALAYVFKKREEPGIKYDDVLSLTMREVSIYLGVEEEEVVLPGEDSPKG